MWKAILGGMNHLDDLSMSDIGNGEKGMICVHMMHINVYIYISYSYLYCNLYVIRTCQ